MLHVLFGGRGGDRAGCPADLASDPVLHFRRDMLRCGVIGCSLRGTGPSRVRVRSMLDEDQIDHWRAAFAEPPAVADSPPPDRPLPATPPQNPPLPTPRHR